MNTSVCEQNISPRFISRPHPWTSKCLGQADGGDQQLFDDGMRELRKAGIQVWPSPDVMVTWQQRLYRLGGRPRGINVGSVGKVSS